MINSLERALPLATESTRLFDQHKEKSTKGSSSSGGAARFEVQISAMFPSRCEVQISHGLRLPFLFYPSIFPKCVASQMTQSSLEGCAPRPLSPSTSLSLAPSA